MKPTKSDAKTIMREFARELPAAGIDTAQRADVYATLAHCLAADPRHWRPILAAGMNEDRVKLAHIRGLI